MFNRTIKVTALVLVLALAASSQINSANDNITELLDQLESKFQWLDYRLALEQWDHYTRGSADSLTFYQGLYNHVLTDKGTYEQLKRGQNKLANELDLRRHQLIQQAFVLGRVETSPDVSSLRDSLSTIDITYQSIYDSGAVSRGELYRIYRTAKSRPEREAAYRSYLQLGDELSDGLSRLFRLRNQQAKKMGYNNFFALSFKQLDIQPDEYIKLLTHLDAISEQPYLDILENVKSNLNMDYPEIWDLGYSYNIVNSQVDAHFLADNQLELITASLGKIGFDLTKMPIYYDLKPRENKSQFAYAFTIKAPHDMRVLGNLTNGLYSTTVLMHEIGHAVNSAEIKQDQSLFRGSLDGAWSEAIAQIFAALVTEQDWLVKYGGTTSSMAQAYLENKKEQDIIYLRQTLLRLQFEYEAYLNPNRDLNNLYWTLFDKYMRLPRHEDLKPWAAVIHLTTHPVYLQNYLYADMIAAQTIDFLKRNYRNVVDNQNTGSFLAQNYLRFGSRYDWRELLKRGTDEELNPEYFIKRLGL